MRLIEWTLCQQQEAKGGKTGGGRGGEAEEGRARNEGELSGSQARPSSTKIRKGVERLAWHN